MIYISATGLQDWIACSYRLKLRSERKDDSEVNEDLQVGTIVHNLLEKEWRNTQAQLQASALFLGKDLNYLSREKLRRSLENYEYFRSMLGEDDETELKFSIKLQDDVTLVGKIDRIVKYSGIILDWKTANSPPSRIDSDIQFLVYYYAYEKMYGKKPSGVYYASLSSGNLIQLKYLKNKDYLFREVIPYYIKNIREGSYARTGIFNSKCFKCLYKESCL